MAEAIYSQRKLLVKAVPGKGLGVFAAETIAADEIIECSPTIILQQSGRQPLQSDGLIDCYAYRWGSNNEGLALALGYGSLYNHSYQPNAVYRCDLENNLIEFRARREIVLGEEITVNYNRDPQDLSPLWFEVRS